MRRFSFLHALKVALIAALAITAFSFAVTTFWNVFIPAIFNAAANRTAEVRA